MARILGQRYPTGASSGFAALITEAMKREGVDVSWEASPLTKHGEAPPPGMES
jgi:hypothetical protein